MSRWEKFPLVAFGLILLLLGIVHRYHLQLTVSGKSRHLQPPILRDEKLESQEESRSSLIGSDTSTHSVQTDYHSSETYTTSTSTTTTSTTTSTSTSETSTTSTSMKSAPATESNLVVFYNRLDFFFADWTFLPLRIPKTGSENMAFIIKKLSRQNNFNQKRFSRNGRGSLTEMELRRLEGSVCGKLSQPTIFDEHIHFLPTSESCRNPVSWITMVGK